MIERKVNINTYCSMLLFINKEQKNKIIVLKSLPSILDKDITVAICCFSVPAIKTLFVRFEKTVINPCAHENTAINKNNRVPNDIVNDRIAVVRK